MDQLVNQESVGSRVFQDPLDPKETWVPQGPLVSKENKDFWVSRACRDQRELPDHQDYQAMMD